MFYYIRCLGTRFEVRNSEIPMIYKFTADVLRQIDKSDHQHQRRLQSSSWNKLNQKNQVQFRQAFRSFVYIDVLNHR
jgi:hypothetical protein